MMWIALFFIAWIVSIIGLWAWLQRRNLQEQSLMRESFKSISMDVLELSAKSFLNLAETRLEKYQDGAKTDLEHRQKEIAAILDPLKTTLQKLEQSQTDIEKRREGAYSALYKQIEQMIASDRELRNETVQLKNALRSPNARGSWGQLHLRRVVEMAGLQNQCDFAEQVTLETEPGKKLRPDLVVRLPGSRYIAVDAKTPLDSYLDASEIQDEERRKQKMLEHADMLRKHIKDLSAKEYWKGFDLSPEYVVLFLPAESFFSAALSADPSLIEMGASHNIVIATPTTLIAILRAVAFGWKQEGLSKSAKEIAKLGAELYERLGSVTEVWNKVGRSLGTAVEAYNQSVASLESRVLVSARKLKEQSGVTKEFTEPEQVDKLTRILKEEPL